MANYNAPPPPAFFGGYSGGGGKIGDSIAELLARRGEILAEGARRSGDIWGNAVNQIGQSLTGGVQQFQQKQQETRLGNAMTAAMGPGTTVQTPGQDVNGDPTAETVTKPPDIQAILGKLPPEERMKAAQQIQTVQASAMEVQQHQAELQKTQNELKAQTQAFQQKIADHWGNVSAGLESHFSDPDGGIGAAAMAMTLSGDMPGAKNLAPFAQQAAQAYAAATDPAQKAQIADAFRKQAAPYVEQGKALWSPEAAKSWDEIHKPDTKTVTIKNADGSETTQIVDNKPGQTFTGAPPRETRSPEVQLAEAIKNGDLKSQGALRQAIAMDAAAKRDPLQQAKTQAELDQLRGKGQPVGVDNYVKTTLSGKQYVDLGDFQTPAEKSKARDEANAKGLMALTKENADSLAASDTTKQNLGAMMQTIEGKLPNDAAGRPLGGLENKLSQYFQTDADLASYNSWRPQAIQAIQALANGKGLRINKTEIDSMVASLPTLTDTVATAKEKLAHIQTMLDNKESTMLTRDRSGSPGGVNAPAAAPTGSKATYRFDPASGQLVAN